MSDLEAMLIRCDTVEVEVLLARHPTSMVERRWWCRLTKENKALKLEVQGFGTTAETAITAAWDNLTGVWYDGAEKTFAIDVSHQLVARQSDDIPF